MELLESRLLLAIPVVGTLPGGIGRDEIPQGLGSGPKITVTRGGYRFDRATQRYFQAVTLQNSGSVPLGGPLSFEVDNLSLPDVSGTNLPGEGSPQIIMPALFNASGQIDRGFSKPAVYVNLDLGDFANSLLAPGAAVTTTLQFKNLNQVAINYTGRVFAGSPASAGPILYSVDSVPIFVDASHPLDLGGGDTSESTHTLELKNISGAPVVLNGILGIASDGYATEAVGFTPGNFSAGSFVPLPIDSSGPKFANGGFYFLNEGATGFKVLAPDETIQVNIRLINTGNIGGTGQPVSGTTFTIHQFLPGGFAKQEIEVAILSGTTATNIANGASIVFGAGTTRTIRIKNTGGTTLTFSKPTATTGFTISNPGALSLAKGATTTFVVTRATSATLGTVRILNNDVANAGDGDGAEGTFRFTFKNPTASAPVPATTSTFRSPFLVRGSSGSSDIQRSTDAANQSVNSIVDFSTITRRRHRRRIFH